MIDIADKLYELNNFNGVFSITAGLGLSSIYRLKKNHGLVFQKNLLKPMINLKL